MIAEADNTEAACYNDLRPIDIGQVRLLTRAPIKRIASDALAQNRCFLTCVRGWSNTDARLQAPDCSLCAAGILRRALPFLEELFRRRAFVYARKSRHLCSCVAKALREFVVADAAVSIED